jgi:hypothetical protein
MTYIDDGLHNWWRKTDREVEADYERLKASQGRAGGIGSKESEFGNPSLPNPDRRFPTPGSYLTPGNRRLLADLNLDAEFEAHKMSRLAEWQLRKREKSIIRTRNVPAGGALLF